MNPSPSHQNQESGKLPRIPYCPVAYLAPCNTDRVARLEVRIASVFRAIDQIPESSIFDSSIQQIQDLINVCTVSARGVQAQFVMPERREDHISRLPNLMPPNVADREGSYIVEQFLFCLKNELPIDAQLKSLVRQYRERHPE